MPFRFRRSVKILPGVKLNVGKKGISTSVGVKGAHVTVGHGKVRSTVGIPGTGMSYTHVTPTKGKQPKPPKQAQPIITRQLQPPPPGPAPTVALWNYTCRFCGHQFQTPGGLVTCPHCGR